MDSRILFGSDQPLTERIPLRAGPLTMIYENGDLRYIRYGEREVVRRIYAAARDRAWGTAPNVLSNVQMDVREDAFEIRYTCENRLNDIDFVWEGHLAGDASGTITFTFDGVARRDFLRNRLGLCVLHPTRLAGMRARIEKVDGTIAEATFPRRIAPQHVVDGIIKPVAPFDEMRALSYEIAPGAWLHIAFEGEVFEMEDQRNWTDGSYKTYCTPLRLPFPVEVKAGERVRQQITLRVNSELRIKNEEKERQRSGVGAVTFSILNSQFSIPKVGMCVSADGKTLTARQAERLRTLKPAHLRIDLPLWAHDWPARLKRAAKQAKAIGAALEIGLFVSDAAEKELTAFVETRHSASPPVNRYLVFHRSENRTGERWLALARRCLGERAVIYGGTNKFFTELNANRPSRAMLALVDGLCYSFNPQVHAFDNASLAESPEAQGETIRTYKTFAKGTPLAITPITLKPRWTLGDPGPEPDDRRGEFDPRQMSLFGAGWTVASLKHIVQADGAGSITIYETTGKRGVMDGRIVFPMYHVFADIAEFGGRVVASRSSDPLAVEGLALRKGKRLRVLLTNLTDRPQTVMLRGIGSKAKVKMLDASNAEAAMKRPEAWRAGASTPLGNRTITLPPCAIARIDA
ncbi:MAG: hypothetical protein RMN52_11100 [Anaerolineae bacterium]|nr:hypothetical protein [Candidatus Roseilinea sp.]MDW8450540.1 hypothetical protein [Anaerolineae bacterium]